MRQKGSRNNAYEERRTELLERLLARLARRDSGYISMRELASAAGVTVPTLTHYFGGRDQLVQKVLEEQEVAGRPYRAIASSSSEPFPRSIRSFLEYLREGHFHGVGLIHAAGLAEGLGNDTLGPSYLANILEPVLQVAEARLGEHVAKKEMRACDLRSAALALIAPLLLLLLHQKELGGHCVRIANIDAFIESHCEAFVLGYRA